MTITVIDNPPVVEIQLKDLSPGVPFRCKGNIYIRHYTWARSPKWVSCVLLSKQKVTDLPSNSIVEPVNLKVEVVE